MIRLTDSEFVEIVEYMRQNYGINLEKKRVLIECRLTKDLEKYGLDSFAKYLELVHKDATGRIAGEMVNRLTTNYTYFMREPSHFKYLYENILPEFCKERKMKLLRAWCAGCSTGEECYSIAMTLMDFKERAAGDCTMNITATDISEEVLAKAEAGIYPLKEMENIPPLWWDKYCIRSEQKKFEIKDSIKNHIRFVRQNLMEPGNGTGKYDLIFCRNVMIYFDRQSKSKLLRILEKRLAPGGYLLIGHAELLTREETNLQQVFPAVYRKKTDVEG